MIRVSDSTEFRRLIEGLAYDITHANFHWKLYRDLQDALGERPIVAQQSNAFWHLTLNAHSQVALQYLCRAFDQEKNSLSLHSWLRTIRSNLHLFDQDEFIARLATNPFVQSLAETPRRPDPNLLDADIGQCSKKDPLVRRLIVYRSMVGAHRNAEAVVQRRHFHLSVPDFEILLDRARHTLNRYSDLFAAETHSVNIIGRDDFRYIFDCVADTVQRSRDRMDAEVKRLKDAS